jgi:transcriptional regulator NrdR family protein
MKQEFQAQKNTLAAKERELDEREANLRNRLEGIAKSEKRLSEQERLFQQERAAFAKVRAPLPPSGQQAAIEDTRETQKAPNCFALESSTTNLGHQCSFDTSVRRQAKTVNLRKRFAPGARVEPSAALVMPKTSQRQPLSDGDMRPNVSRSAHRSKIPVSTARKLSATQVAQPKESAGSTVGSKNQDIGEQPKRIQHTAAARKAKAPLPPTRAPYNTRSAVRNVNQALALRGL